MLLEVKGLNTFYGESHVLQNMSVAVNQGELGHQDAGQVGGVGAQVTKVNRAVFELPVTRLRLAGKFRGCGDDRQYPLTDLVRVRG